jgi:tetratricopeptide (TPR) repeat protein
VHVVLPNQTTPALRLRHTLAEFYQYNGLYKQEAIQYELLLKEEGETVILLNNLAYVLQQDEQLDKALLRAKKALTMAPQSPQILDTLGWIEYESGDLPEAYKHLSEALRLAPKANVILLHLAQVQIALGQQKQAKKLLNKVSMPSSAQQAQQKAMLNKLKF